MRLHGGNRALFYLFVFFSTLILLAGAIVAAVYGGYYNSLDFQGVRLLPIVYIIVALAMVLLAAVGLRLLFMRKPKEPSALLIKNADNGSVFMTSEAMDALVLREARKCQQLNDVKVRVSADPQGVLIRLRVQVKHDSVIPEVAAALQKGVKEGVEQLSGITVRDVSVFVDVMPQPSAAARVE